MAYPAEPKTNTHEELQKKLKELRAIPTTPDNIEKRRILAQTIMDIMEAPAFQAFLRMDAELFSEYITLNQELRRYPNACLTVIEMQTERYFRDRFARLNKIITKIEFTPKEGGNQLGTIINIDYQEGGTSSRTKYYIKSHQGGSTGTAGSFAPPDLKELFVYKVLEYIGYGPKTHFFYDISSPGGFYIATQDLAFTKISGKVKDFTLFENMAPTYHAASADPMHDEARKAIICLDILSRVLVLRDTTTNPGNFGRAHVAPERTKWKLLDFRVLNEPEFYLNPFIFTGFQRSSGPFNYRYADFMIDIFMNPANFVRKITMAVAIIRELGAGRHRADGKTRKQPFIEAADRARTEVIAYAQEHSRQMRVVLESAIPDLEQYVDAIKRNFETLSAGILAALPK